MDAVLVVWSGALGWVLGWALLGRAGYRLGVPEEEPAPGMCANGHVFGGGWRGWIGPACCSGGRLGGAGSGGLGLLCAAACASVASGYALGSVSLGELGVWLLITPVLVLIAVTDAAFFRVPNVLSIPTAVLTATALAVLALADHNPDALHHALLGAAALGFGYLLLHLLNPDEFGYGDSKLALTAGQILGWYGWSTVVTGTFAGLVLAAGAALVLLAARRATRHTQLPFGPSILAGTLLALLLRSN